MTQHPRAALTPPFDFLRDLLHDALGTRVEVASVTVLGQQPDYLVVRVGLHLPPESVIVKLAGTAASLPVSFERTATLHRLVRARTTVPVPHVLAADDSGRRWPWRYCVVAVAPGEQWAAVRAMIATPERADAYRQIGDVAGQLHTITFPTFGEIDAGSDHAAVQDDMRPVRPAWPAALAARTSRMLGQSVLRDSVLRLIDDHAGVLAEVRTPTLSHDDLHGHNVLFGCQDGRWQLTAVLDFDKAWAGDPESDLARLELWRGMTSPEFWAAYRAHRGLSPQHGALRPLYQLLWCLEYGRSTPQHLADTRQVCLALGLSAERTGHILGTLAGGPG